MSAQRGGHRQENPGSGHDVEGQHSCFTKISGKGVIAFTKKYLSNEIHLASCVYAIAVDPLFFFTLSINEDKKCLLFNSTLYFIAIALRSVADLISLANIILEFRGQTEMVADANWTIAKRYLRSYFLSDVLAILPLPQVLFPIFIFRELRRLKYSGKKKIYNALVPFQYGLRALRIYRAWKKVKRTNKKLAQNVLVGSVFNFILYILTAQVLGGWWYFFAVGREMVCWQIACEKHIGCSQSPFSCDSSSRNYNFINDYCPIHKTQNTMSHDFGIFLEAIQLGILASTDLPQKMVHCFWWGLRNLSSFGQNLQTSARSSETLFAVVISISGMLLFLYFIGNLQMYMKEEKSTEGLLHHLDEQKQKTLYKIIERKTRSWMNRNELTQEIKDNINAYFSIIEEQGKEVDMENTLPIDWLDQNIKKQVKVHLCLPRLKEVPMLEQNDTLLNLILKRLRPVYYKEGSYIFREGEPIDRMVFITSGIVLKLIRRTINGEGSGTVLECIHKDHGDLDEVNEILNWGVKTLEDSSPHGLSNLPISKITLKTHTEVDGFDVMAKDLREVLRRAHNRQQAVQGGSTSTTL